MKKIITAIFLFVLGSQMAISQVPEKFNYQGVLRNESDEFITNTTIGIQISLYEGSSSETAVYVETHETQTNSFGQFSVQVGTGTTTDDFSAVDWPSGQVYLKVSVDEDGGTSYADLPKVQLITVPYALYANDVANKDDADADATNELQQLSFQNDSIFISDGNGINLPYDSSNWVIQGNTMYYNGGNVGIGSSAPVSNLEVKATQTGSDALFQVINSNNDTVFAVYPDGVKIFLDAQAKGKIGGFAVSGRNPAKAGDVDIMKVTMDSTRIYVSDTVKSKGKIGGFAVSGRNPAKGDAYDYLVVTGDSTRIYVNDTTATKGKIGGFAVSGRNPAKGGSYKFMDMTKNNYLIGHEAGRSITEGLYNSYFGYEAGYSNSLGKNGIFIGFKSGYSNTIGNYNAFIGNYAGYSNTEGYSNIFVGDSAGKSNTIGELNVFIGKDAGKLNTEGELNIMMGHQAGTSNTTGRRNVFIGPQAGYSNTEGNLNTFIGTVAGVNNTKGGRNVFIGQAAGYWSDTASYNIFIGDKSGVMNKNGANNVFLGFQTGFYNDNASYNVFIGENCAYNNKKGEYNTFIGSKTGYNHYNGNSNVYIGEQAGYTGTSANENTYIGYRAGWSATGSNNIFIGSYAGYDEIGSNKLYIDNAISDNSQSLIFGDFITKELRLNGAVHIRDFIQLQPLNDAPTNFEAGTVYFSNNDKKLKIWNGTEWKTIAFEP